MQMDTRRRGDAVGNGSTYRSIGALLSGVTAAPAAQADVNVVDDVEELLDDGHLPVRLDADFLESRGEKQVSE